MSERKADSPFRSAIAKAAACCPIAAGDEPLSITQYLKAVLNAVAGGAGVRVDVTPLPYQMCSKLPVVITLDEAEPRLLWYYKGMSASALADELCGLFSDLPVVTGRVSA